MPKAHSLYNYEKKNTYTYSRVAGPEPPNNTTNTYYIMRVSILSFQYDPLTTGSTLFSSNYTQFQ